MFFQANPDVNPSTYPTKNIVFVLMKVEENIFGELEPKTATNQLKICMQDGPEQVNETIAELIEKGFIAVPKKLEDKLMPARNVAIRSYKNDFGKFWIV